MPGSSFHLPQTLGASSFSVNYAGKQVSAVVGLSTMSIHAQQKIIGQGHLTWPLAIVAFFAAFGNSFTHGYNTGVLNSPQLHIKNFLNSSYIAHYGSVPSNYLLELLWSCTVSIYLIGGCGGAFAAGALADRFGRKKAIMMMAVPGLIGDLLFGLCKVGNSLEMLIIGRLIMGFSCGAGSGLVPMYLTEIAPVNIRGAMGVLHQLALTIGILVSQLLGLSQLLGSESLWPLLLALSAVPFISCCVILPFYPDSPRWLLSNKRSEARVVRGEENSVHISECNISSARQALQIFRGEDDVEHDINEMKRDVREQQREPAWSLKKLLASVPHRIPFLVVTLLMVVQQLSGINMVFYYSDSVFRGARIPADYTQYVTLGVGTVNVLMTVVSVILVEKTGRRPLLIGGLIGMVVALTVMTIALNIQKQLHWFSYISILATVAFVVFFAIGPGCIPQFIGAELFKQGPRPPAMSFAGLMNWAANFIVGISFPFIQNGTGPYCMLFFIVFMVIFGIIIWKFLPETKNKSFAEIATSLGIQSADDENDPLKEISNGHAHDKFCSDKREFLSP